MRLKNIVKVSAISLVLSGSVALANPTKNESVFITPPLHSIGQNDDWHCKNTQTGATIPLFKIFEIKGFFNKGNHGGAYILCHKNGWGAQEGFYLQHTGNTNGYPTVDFRADGNHLWHHEQRTMSGSYKGNLGVIMVLDTIQIKK